MTMTLPILDGRTVHPARDGPLRVRHDAEDALLQHLLRLGAYQRRMRFNGAVSDAVLRAYCRGFRGMRPVLLGYCVGGEMRGAGELVVISDCAASRCCEVALSVEQDYEGRGIGTALLQRLLRLAANRRIRTMHVLWLRGNQRMERLAGKLGAARSSDGHQVQGRIPVPPPSELSVFEEALSEGARRAGLAPKEKGMDTAT